MIDSILSSTTPTMIAVASDAAPISGGGTPILGSGPITMSTDSTSTSGSVSASGSASTSPAVTASTSAATTAATTATSSGTDLGTIGAVATVLGQVKNTETTATEKSTGKDWLKYVAIALGAASLVYGIYWMYNKYRSA